MALERKRFTAPRGVQDPEVARALAKIADVLDELRTDAPARTRKKDVALGTTTKQVFHGLGVPVTAFRVIRRNANAVVYEDETATNASPALYINLVASATVTVDLEFE